MLRKCKTCGTSLVSEPHYFKQCRPCYARSKQQEETDRVEETKFIAGLARRAGVLEKENLELKQEVSTLRAKVYGKNGTTTGSVNGRLIDRILKLVHPDVRADAAHHAAERNDLTKELILARKQNGG